MISQRTQRKKKDPKPKTCLICKHPFRSSSSTQVVCKLSCALKYSQAKRLKKEKAQANKKAKALRAKKRALIESIKPKSKWLSEAQTEFNQYIRAGDYRDPCISCGRSVQEVKNAVGLKVGGSWDAGHYRSRGAAGHLRFNLNNCHKQCKSCNGGSGKYARKARTVAAGYRQGLIQKLGLHKVEALEKDNTIRSFDIHYLKRVKRIFNKKARRVLKRTEGINRD